MSHVLITGASGFIGQPLARALRKQGHSVRCLVRKSSATEQLREAGAEFVYGDVTDSAACAEAVSGVDTVYHLAGMTAALKYDEMLRVNRDGCWQLAAAASKLDRPPTVLVVSSIAAAGPTSRGQIRRESDPPNPCSHYGRSKLAGERAAAEFSAQLPITVVRPGIVFGPSNTQMLPMFQFIRRFRCHPVPGWTVPPLSYIYIDDLVEILLRAAERGTRLPANGAAASGQGYYFAAAPEYPDYAALGRLVRPFLQRPWAWIVPMPKPLPKIVAGTNEVLMKLRGKPEMFNLDKIREAGVASWACSHEAVKADLDFEPPESLTDRFEQTVAWYRRAGWIR